MGKVDRSRYGNARPKLTTDDLEGGDFLVLTIANFGEATISNEEGTKVTPYLEFRETGDKVHWLNQTQIGYLIDGFGSDESEDWQGHPVPVEKHTAVFRGTSTVKLWVSPPERWAELFKAAGVRGKVAAKKSAVVGRIGKGKGGKRK